MTKDQAAMKDLAARKAVEKKWYYPKGRCQNCGGQIFRSYDPTWMKWKSMCWTCSEKDAAPEPKPKLVKKERVVSAQARELRARFEQIMKGR